MEAAPQDAMDVESAGPWFCYLLECLRAKSKIETRVIVARESYSSLDLAWRVEAKIGPYTQRPEAEEAAAQWIRRARGLASRKNYADELLAERMDVRFGRMAIDSPKSSDELRAEQMDVRFRRMALDTLAADKK